MEKTAKDTIQKKKHIIKYLLYLIVITSLISTVTFSRYLTTLSGSDSARVAQFATNVTVTDREGKTVNVATVGFATMYATSKLNLSNNPDDYCMFEDEGVTVIRKVTITNQSEVAVHANINITDILNMEVANGIVWCIFDEGEFVDSKTREENIMEKLGSTSYSYTDFTWKKDLVAALKVANQTTIDTWNSNTNLGLTTSDNSRTLTIVFWADHDGVKAYKESKSTASDANVPTTIDELNLTFTVTQID